jgi:hypothetical protein
MAYTEELARAERRLAAMIDKRVADEEAQRRADAAERRAADAAQAREDAERRRQYQVKYADAYQSFGVDPPAPVDDEAPGAFRSRLFDGLARKLPSGHDLAGIRADDLPSGPARVNFEQMLLQAAVAEGAAPSPENLPRDGSMVTRVRVDPDTGLKKTEFFGTRSFIHDLSMTPLKVLRFVGKGGKILWGQPFDEMPKTR